MSATSKYCPRGQHRGGWEHGSPPLDKFTDGSGWACPGIAPDGSACGYELRIGVQEKAASSARELAAEAWHQFLLSAVSDSAEPHDVFAWAYMAGWVRDKWPAIRDIVPPPDLTGHDDLEAPAPALRDAQGDGS